MNTSEQNPQNTSRPFGYWLKAVDRLMAAEFATAFDGEGDNVGRRDWRVLNIVDGTMPARRPLNARKLRGLIERGWVVTDGDGWTLTDEGRAAKDRLGTIVDGIRSKVTDAVSEEDMATTLASLEKIARAFGWDEETRLPRSRRHGFGPRGFGRGFGPGFGPGHGFGHGFGPGHSRLADHDDAHGFAPDHGFGPHSHGHGDREAHCAHGHHGDRQFRGHGPHRAARFAQHAYERGFGEGFSRGLDA